MSPGADDVVLRVAGSPENVRTARLVAAAVARRGGLSEERVDEVRIAVGEAVTWAMRDQETRVIELVLGPGELVADEFVVTVERSLRNRGRVGVTGGGDPGDGSDDGSPPTGDAVAAAVPGAEPDALSLSLLRGLADRVDVRGEATVLTWSDAHAT